MEVKMSNGSSVLLNEAIFDVPFNEPLIHQVVTAFLAGGRMGTKAQKTRSEVSGGGAKPWRQKGTGRARAGTIRSPIWRTGGVAFAAKPRDFSQKVNKKMYRSAVRSIFAELFRQNRLTFLENFELESYKTKDCVSYLKENNLGDDILIISELSNNNAFMATANLPLVELVDVGAINPVLLLSHKLVAIDKEALSKINEWLS